MPTSNGGGIGDWSPMSTTKCRLNAMQEWRQRLVSLRSAASERLAPTSSSSADSTATGDQEAHGPRRIDYERWLAYVAGYIDGEGCIGYRGTATVEVKNTFPDTLVELRRTFGGNIRRRVAPNDRARTTFVWTVCGDNARHCIACVKPFLIEKRRQAELLLLVSEYPPRSEQRNTLLTELSLLKRIDYGLVARGHAGAVGGADEAV